jgi:hypothetical protein
MAEFVDPLNDPRFPGRPQHADFWVIVDALNALDGRATEGGQGTPTTLRPPSHRRHLLCSARFRGRCVNPRRRLDPRVSSP